MNSQSSQRCSRLRTDTAQSAIKSALNKLCRERREGLDDETKISDFPVDGEVFLLTSPFIERSVVEPGGKPGTITFPGFPLRFPGIMPMSESVSSGTRFRPRHEASSDAHSCRILRHVYHSAVFSLDHTSRRAYDIPCSCGAEDWETGKRGVPVCPVQLRRPAVILRA